MGARSSHAPEIPFPSPPFERPPRRLKFHNFLRFKFHDSPGYSMNQRILIKKSFIYSRSSYIKGIARNLNKGWKVFMCPSQVLLSVFSQSYQHCMMCPNLPQLLRNSPLEKDQDRPIRSTVFRCHHNAWPVTLPTRRIARPLLKGNKASCKL